MAASSSHIGSTEQTFDDAIIGSSSSTVGRKPSGVWENFIQEDINGERWARCKTCSAIWKHPKGGSTTNLHKHTRTHAPKEPSQMQINLAGGSLSNFRYSHANAREGLAKYLVQTESPISQAENLEFEYFVQTYLQPEFKRVPRNTAKADMFKVFKQNKDFLIGIIASLPGKISLTSDSWESVTGLHYLCVTAHWIDQDWILQKRIIGFRAFEFPHTANAIASGILEVLQNFQCVSKIFTISFDNATNNTAAIEILKTYLHPDINSVNCFHVRCICHIINLCVQKGLKVISPHLTKVKNAILLIKASGKRRKAFKDICTNLYIKYKQMLLDVTTR